MVTTGNNFESFLSTALNDANRDRAAFEEAQQDRFAIGKDGKILGLVKVDKNTANLINGAFQAFNSQIRSTGGDFIRKTVHGLASKKHVPINDAQADKIANVAQEGMRYGIAVLYTALDVMDKVKANKKELKETREDLAPVMQALGRRSSISNFLKHQDNEVVEVMRRRYFKSLKSDVFASFITVPNSMLNLYAMNQEDKLEPYRADMIGENLVERREGEKLDQLKPQPDYPEKREGLVNNKKNLDRLNKYGALGVAMASGIVGANVKGDKDKSEQEPTAFDMILALKRHLEMNKGDTKIKGMGNIEGERVTVPEYIRAIFQQHQMNLQQLGHKNENTIGDKFDDEFNPICERIAESLSSGEMDALALVNLVGQRKIVKSRARQFATEREVDNIIAEQRSIFRAGEPEDLEAYYANLSYNSKDEIKAILGGLSGEDRALFASLLPDAALIDLGVKKKEIDSLRRDMEEQIRDRLAVALMDLVATEPEELKEFGLTSGQVKELQELRKQWEEEGIKAIESSIGTAGQPGVEEVARDAKGLWENIVKGTEKLGDRSTAMQERLKAAKERKEELTGSLSDTDNMHAADPDKATQDGGHAKSSDEMKHLTKVATNLETSQTNDRAPR